MNQIVLSLISLTIFLGGLNQAVASLSDFEVYYGYLHAHTEVSDGQGSLDEAFTHARDVAKMDFFAVTEHDYYPDDMTDQDWQNIQSAANRYNQDGQFVAFWGFEWTSDTDQWQTQGLGLGHMTVINSPQFCSSSKDGTRTLSEFSTWLNEQDGAIAFFNHPGQYNTTFNHFDFPFSSKIVGMELWNRSQDYYQNTGYDPHNGLNYFNEALQKAWRIGAGGGQDNHQKQWGTENDWRMGVLATDKTRDSLLQAFRARRFFTTTDKNLRLSFKCGKRHMGAIVKPSQNKRQCTIEADDGDGEKFRAIHLVKNGQVIKRWLKLNSATPKVSIKVNLNPMDYLYVRVYQADQMEWAAISSPIFVRR